MKMSAYARFLLIRWRWNSDLSFKEISFKMTIAGGGGEESILIAHIIQSFQTFFILLFGRV